MLKASVQGADDPEDTSATAASGGHPNEMATIRATCTECGDVEMTTADVWVRVCDDDDEGTYHFRCPDAPRSVAKPAEPHIVELLLAAGVAWSTWSRPAELRERRSGAPLTHDDLLEFHEMLRRDDWFQRLAETRDEDDDLI